ncbi:MAG: type II toxin-antitoxin system HicA family toxin [Synechocystis sp.]|nr:type II toxin-antitoxin system HicA family toxin [Synechocystis sp.]
MLQRFWPVPFSAKQVKRLSLALGRLALVEVFALSLGLIAVLKEHQVYWTETVPLRQATTLSVLGKTLPTTLAVAIAREDRQAIQTLLDGSYEFYALVLTDVTGQRILQRSQSLRGENAQAIWSRLIASPFDVITNPPSLPGQSTPSPDIIGPPTANNLQGVAIARIYYLQNPPLSLVEDLRQWLRYPDKTQRRFHIYSMIVTIWALWGFAVWATTEYLRTKRRQMYDQLSLSEQSQRIFKQEAQQLRQLLTERSAQNTFLIERLQTARAELESNQRQQRQEVLGLQAAIAEYETEINKFAQSDQIETVIWQKELQQAKEKLRQAQQRETQTNEKVKLLNNKIEQLGKQRDEAYRRIERLSQQPADQSTLEAARLEIEQQQALANYAIEETTRLETIKQTLEEQIFQLEQRNNHLSWRNQELESQLDSLGLLETNGQATDSPSDHPPSIPLSNLANISTKVTIHALERLGFVLDHQKGSHVIMKRRTEVEQTCSIPNKPELRPPTLKHILNQAGLTLEEFQGALK